MTSHPKQTTATPAVDEAGSAERRSAAGPDRRVVRTVDLTAIESAEMTPGFVARELGQRGEKTKGRPADKTFRDGLYDKG